MSSLFLHWGESLKPDFYHAAFFDHLLYIFLYRFYHFSDRKAPADIPMGEAEAVEVQRGPLGGTVSRSEFETEMNLVIFSEKMHSTNRQNKHSKAMTRHF